MSTGALDVPALSLVVLIGATGSGKSSFARAHFAPSEVLSSDACRAMVSDDENDQSATGDAFDVLNFIAGKRLERGRLTVVDATNVQPEARRQLVTPGPRARRPAGRDRARPSRAGVPRTQCRPRRPANSVPTCCAVSATVPASRDKAFHREGFRHVYVLRSAAEVAAASITRVPGFRATCATRAVPSTSSVTSTAAGPNSKHFWWSWLRASRTRTRTAASVSARHPEGRRCVFLGDLVDRGPDIAGVLRLVMGMVSDGGRALHPGQPREQVATRVAWSQGADHPRSRGIAGAIECSARASSAPRSRRFLDGLIVATTSSTRAVSSLRMRVSPNALHGRASTGYAPSALYGHTTGETDEYGLPVRYPWAEEYRGKATVVYGHTPVPDPEWLNNTLCVDTGSVFGGRLTALRYPSARSSASRRRRSTTSRHNPFLPDLASARPPAPQPPRPRSPRSERRHG